MESKKTQTNKEKLKDETIKEESFKKLYGKFFIFLIIGVICFEYYFFIFEVTYKSLNKYNFIDFLIYIVLFHFLLIMMIWCLITTMTTHPGEIPLYWGFHIGDQESKRKRYCLICNAFKPERSHHCSICNICILNMDHHCPWVNNCIGFYNRKFFMQLLSYLLFLTIYIDIMSFPLIYNILLKLYTIKFKYTVLITKLYSLVAFTINFIISVLIFFFFKFHVSLVVYNTTTIESLDPIVWHENKFRLSLYNNWIQVFGENKILWFFPLHFESGRPVGDGLTWKTNIASTLQDEFSTTHRHSKPKSNNVNSNVPSNNVSQVSQNIKSCRDNKMELSKIIVPLGMEEKSQKSSQVKLNFDNYKANFDNQKRPNFESNIRSNYDSYKQSDVYASTKDAMLFSPTSISHNIVKKSNDFNMEKVLGNFHMSSVKKD